MIDELRRKKFLKDLSGDTSVDRSPASMMPDTAQSMEERITPDVADVPDTQELTKRQKMTQQNTMADIATGAAPALIGLLSGNYNRTAMGFNQSNKYVSDLAAKDILKSKDLVKVDVGGKPILTPASEAADMQAYVAPVKGGSGKSYTAQTIKNKDTGEVTTALWDGSNYAQKDPITGSLSTLDPQKWTKFISDKYSPANTMEGGKDVWGIDPVTGKVRKVISTPGRGSVMGGATKEEYDIITKGAGKGRDIIAKTDQDLAATREARDTIGSTQDPMTFSTTIGNLLRTAVGEKRLSDIEGAKYMGDDYKGFMLKGEEYLRSKYGGQIPETVRSNAINLADYVQRKMESQKAATVKSYSGAPSLSTKGKETVKKLLGTEGQIAPASNWKGKYGL